MREPPHHLSPTFRKLERDMILSEPSSECTLFQTTHPQIHEWFNTIVWRLTLPSGIISQWGNCKPFLDKPGNRDLHKVSRIGRLDLRLISPKITGHGRFNRHLPILGLSDSEICRGRGDEEKTPFHLLT